jgi:FkbM family methyltransferase
MPPFKELRDKLQFRIKNRVHATALKALHLTHTLPSGTTIQVESYADWTIYNDIFVDGEYDPAIAFALAKAKQGPKSVAILDLGANVGFFSLRVGELLFRENIEGLKTELLLVEGSPTVFKKLNQRLAGQPTLKDRYRATNGLVGQRTGTGTIYEFSYHGLISTVPRRLSRPQRVPFVDLDALCKGVPRLNLIKCDIEGAEEIFIPNYPELLRKTDAIVVEFHHTGIDYELCIRSLKEAGLARRDVLVDKKIVTTELFTR